MSNASDTRSWNDIQTELGRKAISVLHERIHQHSVERTLSDHELRLVVDTLFDTISGLVPWDVTDAIYAVRKELGDE